MQTVKPVLSGQPREEKYVVSWQVLLYISGSDITGSPIAHDTLQIREVGFGLPVDAPPSPGWATADRAWIN